MKRLVHEINKALGSALGAVTLIAVFIIFLVLANVVDYYLGPKAAQILFFNSWTFGILLALVAYSLTISLFQRLPYKKRLRGFYLVHIGLITLIVSIIISSFTNISAYIETLPFKESRSAYLNSLELTVTERATGVVEAINLKDTLVNQNVGINIGPVKVLDIMPFSLSSFVLRNEENQVSSIISYNGEEKYLSTGSKDAPSFFRGKGFELLLLNSSMLSCIVDINTSDCSNIFKDVPISKVKGDLCKEDIFFIVKEGFLNLSDNCTSSKIVKNIQNENEDLKLISFNKDQIFQKEYKPTLDTKESQGVVVKLQYNNEIKFLTKKNSVEVVKDSLFYDVQIKNRSFSLPFNLGLKKVYTQNNVEGISFNDYYADVFIDSIEQRISLNNPIDYKGWTIYLDSVLESNEYPTKLKLMLLYDPIRYFKILGFFIFCVGLFLLLYERKGNV